MEKPIVALIYDFDKTLATNDMQAFSFIPNLGMTEKEFWGETAEFSDRTGTESVLAYLHTMIKECQERGIPLTKTYLNSLGKDVKFYEGVTTWFKRINEYADSIGIKVEHYIISSGNKEIIEGSSIAKEFKAVYGCEFLYNRFGVAYYPKNIINYTLKTQYLWRISKGVKDVTDDKSVNSRVVDKHVEFRNMIYLGDGLTDIPCMTVVKEKGGKAIAVYQPNKKDVVEKLLDDNRVNYVCKSDFRANSTMEKLVKLILDSISITEKLLDKENNANV